MLNEDFSLKNVNVLIILYSNILNMLKMNKRNFLHFTLIILYSLTYELK